MGHTRSDSALSTWKDLGYMILHGFTCLQLQCTSHNWCNPTEHLLTIDKHKFRINTYQDLWEAILQAYGAMFVFPCVSCLQFMRSKGGQTYQSFPRFPTLLYQPSDAWRIGMAATNFLADCKHLSRLEHRTVNRKSPLKLSRNFVPLSCRTMRTPSQPTQSLHRSEVRQSPGDLNQPPQSFLSANMQTFLALQCLSPSWTWTLWKAKYGSCKHGWYSICCLCRIEYMQQ